MRVAVNSRALPVYKKNSIASLLCIFETTVLPAKSDSAVMFCYKVVWGLESIYHLTVY